MKGLIGVVGLGFILVFGFSVSRAEVAKKAEKLQHSLTENLRKAGQELLQNQEAKLQGLKEKIDKYIQEEISKDNWVSGKEINALRKEIRRFNKEKKRADKRLRIYNLKTATTTIDKRSEQVLSGYIIKDRDGKIRKLFAELTGKDLPVGRTINWTITIFGTFLIFVAFMYWFVYRKDTNGENICIIKGIVLFAIGVPSLLYGVGVL